MNWTVRRGDYWAIGGLLRSGKSDLLALAAGLALPLLSLFGYAPGVRDAGALQALAIAYCLLPCLLKMLAAVCLYVLVIRPAREESST